MINLHLDIKHADIISTDKKEYTYFFRTPIILDEEHTLSCTNVVASMGAAKVIANDFIVESVGNDSYLNITVGTKFNIALEDHGYDRGGAIIKLEYADPEGTGALMIVDSIVNVGSRFILNETFELDEEELPFTRTAGTDPLTLKITDVENVSRVAVKTAVVQNNGNYAYVGVNVGDKFDINLNDHGYDRGNAIIKIEYIQPPGSTAYMSVDTIVYGGDNFQLNEVFTLDDAALPFQRTSGAVAMKIQATEIEFITKIVERLDVRLENILYHNPYYCNSDKKYTPTILNYNLVNKSVNMLMPQLLLLKQIISNIKLIITDQDGQTRDGTDRFNISFCLKKKSDELIDNQHV